MPKCIILSGKAPGKKINMTCTAAAASPGSVGRQKSYDYLLKFLLVGDSDVGKEEILSGLEDGASESPYGGHNGEYDNPNFPSVCKPWKVGL